MTLFYQLLAIGGTLLGFFLLVDGIAYILANTGGRGDSRTGRRLNFEEDGEPQDHIEVIARQDDELTSHTAIGRYFETLATRADIALPPYRIYFMIVLLTVLLFVIFILFLPFIPKALLLIIAAITASALPIMYLNGKAQDRVNKFQEQFPDALDLIVRSLKVGHPLSAALSTIAKEIPNPLGAEFEIAARQVAYGKSTPEAINAITKRVNLQDVRFFAVAVQIHHEAGGNLAEILSGLSTIIRGRFQLFRKVKALTVEGRFSAWFLSLFPVVMIFVMAGMQPGYYEKVSDFAYFPHAVVFTFFLLVVNVIAMKMMTKLEV
ncbi:type II secretion system F family protein [Hyphomonas sp. UBA4494]|uniref:type II secretion system F family protein n=1 Tax=Hyphomonas sp. UBA4494 TaxID=1946631 RepID=UPI0025C27C1D|nr:type II secretion system F family protein [Hyphomonas sp. UBA4494]